MNAINTDIQQRNDEGQGTFFVKEEASRAFPHERTAILVIDRGNDFLSEGGTGWELTITGA